MMEDRSSLRPYVDIWKKCKDEGDKRISFAASKIKVMKDKLNELKTIESKTLEYEYIECPEYKATNVPPALSENWNKYPEYYTFGGEDTHYWIHDSKDE